MKSISICLFSGGIDSTVAATLEATRDNTDIYLLSVFYNQGAEQAERLYSAKVADWLMDKFPNVREHFLIDLNRSVRKSKNAAHGCHPWVDGFMGWRTPENEWAQSGYPSTRDEAFTLLAVAAAESRLQVNPDAESARVLLATNADDLQNFEDLEPANFSTHLQNVVNGKLTPSSGRSIRIALPLIQNSKAEVIKLGRKISAPLHLTWSCYMGSPERPCGECDQCTWRKHAFNSAGITDEAISEFV